MNMKWALSGIGVACGIALEAFAQSGDGSVAVARDALTGVDWVTVAPEEFPSAINNPTERLPRSQAGGLRALAANLHSLEYDRSQR